MKKTTHEPIFTCSIGMSLNEKTTKSDWWLQPAVFIGDHRALVEQKKTHFKPTTLWLFNIANWKIARL
jgi:hypothetical protein